MVLAAVLALQGCSKDDHKSTVADAPTVTIKNRTFTPAEITVDAGATVTWRFEDGSTEHTVTGATFQSERMSKGEFRHRFNTPGTSTYRCTVHPSMQGRVVVR